MRKLVQRCKDTFQILCPSMRAFIGKIIHIFKPMYIVNRLVSNRELAEHNVL